MVLPVDSQASHLAYEVTQSIARVGAVNPIDIAPTDVLADLGLDSIAVVEIVAGLERQLGVVIPDQDVTEMVTVADLLQAVSRQTRAG